MLSKTLILITWVMIKNKKMNKNLIYHPNSIKLLTLYKKQWDKLDKRRNKKKQWATAEVSSAKTERVTTFQ